MVDCSYCRRKIKDIPFKCHRCMREYCSKHRLPEDHNCSSLLKQKEKNQDRWKKTFSEIFSDKGHGKKSVQKKKREKDSHQRKRKPLEKLNHFFTSKTRNFFSWLNSREHRRYNFERRFNYLLRIILPLVISIVAYVIFYSNAQKLNEINLWIIRLGGILILISIFFIIKYGIKFIKELINILKRQKNWLKYLIVILIFFLLWQAYINNETVLNPVFDLYNETNFSLFSPISLGNFSFESNSDSSGGKRDFISTIKEVIEKDPEREEECMQTFEKLNEIRVSYGKNMISWDDRAYKLAVARSKDMQENDYMDHTSPTGQCPENMKSSYGFKSNEYLAENAGGMSYYSKGHVAGDCDEAVDSWLSSRGHRYNLLYDDHKSGAIGCYYEICVFLGIHNNFYGLGGGGECYTAAEGEAYWDGVGKQPGEI